MNPVDDAPDDLEPGDLDPAGVDMVRGEADLSAATAQMRAAEPPSQMAEVAGRVRRVARAAPRRTQLVRAAAPRTHLLVSTAVITAVLHERLAPSLVDAAVRRVRIDVDHDRELRSLTVELVVRYGVPIPALADQARAALAVALDDLLGTERELSPEIGQVRVVDVTVGDPNAVDSSDE